MSLILALIQRTDLVEANHNTSGPRGVDTVLHGFALRLGRAGIVDQFQKIIRLFTRRGFDWTRRYPWIVHSARRLPVTRFLIDGEAVCCGEEGISDFERLHSGADNASVFLYAFDLLAIDGADIRHERLDDRRAKLGELLARPDGIRFSEHLTIDGEKVFRHVCKLGLEGIVSKRRDAPYRSGRSKAWLKIKNPESPAMRRLIEET